LGNFLGAKVVFMQQPVAGQLDLMLTGNEGKANQGGIDFFKAQQAAGPAGLKDLER